MVNDTDEPNGGMEARRRGFTLVELLVALGIIGLLAAIILPVFANARERGRRASCQSNLRQIGLAVQAYVQDNNGDYPLPFPWQGAITPYIKSQEVFRCPSLPSDYPAASNYAWDLARLDVFLPPYPTRYIRGTSEASIVHPATVVLCCETGFTTSDGVSWYDSDTPFTTSCGRSGEGGTTIHGGGGDYAFVDGHVQWLTPKGIGEVDCVNGPPPAPFTFGW